MNSGAEYLVSDVYENDIYTRFPQWVDHFEGVIQTQTEGNDWIREEQREKRFK